MKVLEQMSFILDDLLSESYFFDFGNFKQTLKNSKYGATNSNSYQSNNTNSNKIN
jgi:hypothetical protein